MIGWIPGVDSLDMRQLVSAAGCAGGGDQVGSLQAQFSSSGAVTTCAVHTNHGFSVNMRMRD